MPFSPFTLLFGTTLTLLATWVLLSPDDQTQLIAFKSLAAVPILIAIFTWSAVRSAAPFDEQAFHRTLPPGDGVAFGRVVGVHLLLLTVVALSVCGYGLYRGFGWATISYGMLMITVPITVLMAAAGIAASCGCSRGSWRIFAFVAIFAAPALSLALRNLLREGFAPEGAGQWAYGQFHPYPARLTHYVPGLRTMILTALLLYPLIWWLVAVRRRRVAGLFFAAWTGALLPWLYIYGSFFEIRGINAEIGDPPPAAFAKTPLNFSRKPGAGGRRVQAEDLALVEGEPGDEAPPPQQWIPMDDLISVDGLKEGEFFSLMSFAVADPSSPDGMSGFGIPSYEINRHGQPTQNMSWTWAGRSGAGRTVWGEQAVWEHLRARIPAHESFEPLPGSPEIETRLAVNPNAMIGHYLRPAGNKASAEVFKMTWMMQIIPGFRWLDGGSFDLGKKERRRVPGRAAGAGTLEVVLRGPFQKHCDIIVTSYRDGLPNGDGPWFGDLRAFYGDSFAPRFMLVDEEGKRVRAISLTSPDRTQKLLLGYRDQWKINIPLKEESSRKEFEALRRSRLHLFFPSRGEQAQQVTLPPP